MINITEQHVQDFKNWQLSLKHKIRLMKNAVQEAEPKKYEKNPFYIKLDESEKRLESMTISAQKIEYAGKEVSTNFEFGRYLLEYWNQIKITSTSNSISVAMINAEDDLFAIFKGIE